MALRATATGQYMQKSSPNMPFDNGQMTCELWFNADSIPNGSNQQQPFFIGNNVAVGGATQRIFCLFISRDNSQLFYYAQKSTTVASQASTGVALVAGTWYYARIAIDGRGKYNMAIFKVDGSLHSQTSGTDTNLASTWGWSGTMAIQSPGDLGLDIFGFVGNVRNFWMSGNYVTSNRESWARATGYLPPWVDDPFLYWPLRDQNDTEDLFRLNKPSVVSTPTNIGNPRTLPAYLGYKTNPRRAGLLHVNKGLTIDSTLPDKGFWAQGVKIVGP